MPSPSSNSPSMTLRIRAQNSGSDGPNEPLIHSLTEEMIRRWMAGEEVLAEEFLDRHPVLWQQPQDAFELIYEEICQRKERGQLNAEGDLLRRFPKWKQQLEVMLEFHRLLKTSQRAPLFPESGATIAGFHLLKKLGSGAAGRVFLARQPALADRPVVVKITSLQGQEHLNLARLQHTHIVPLYATHDDASRNLRILCMPYFGGITLDELLKALADVPMHQRTGERLLAILGASGVEATGPARNILGQLAFDKAICWIGVCLAEALQYAHESGLVHFDLKPSNVLIAADGQPMLLDFHLARPPIQPGGLLPASLGGTPGYMPPEQELAFAAVCNGQAIPVTVDHRADLYAFGAILYQSLGGSLPYCDGISPALAHTNPLVTVGLSDIVEKCLQREATARYADAAALAADLRCHLYDLPLQGVGNRSPVERFRKWRRRSPNALRTLALLGAVVAAVAIMLLGVLSHWNHLLWDAEFALEEGRRNWQVRQRFDEARDLLKNGKEHAHAVPFQNALIAQFDDELQKLEQAQALVRRDQVLAGLHTVAEQVRALSGIESLPTPRLIALDKSCQMFWSKRQVIQEWLLAAPNEEASKDLLDLALFAAELQVRLAPESGKNQARAKALQDLDEAEQRFGPSVILDHERIRYCQAMNRPHVEKTRPSSVAKTAWEHCALGRIFLKAGELDRASDHLNAALAIQPHGFWPNFYQGLCAHRRGRFAESIAAFSVCIGSSPGVSGAFFNRAASYVALGLPELARRDLDYALELDPQLAPAALNRGTLHYQAKRFPEAEADLQLALELGANPATVHFNLSLIHVARNDPVRARASLQEALTHQPDHAMARNLLTKLNNLQR